MLTEIIRWRIRNHEWTKNDANAVAAEFLLNSTVDSARYVLSVTSYASMPKPMLRCDHVGNDATTLDDLVDLNRQAMSVLKVR